MHCKIRILLLCAAYKKIIAIKTKPFPLEVNSRVTQDINNLYEGSQDLQDVQMIPALTSRQYRATSEEMNSLKDHINRANLNAEHIEETHQVNLRRTTSAIQPFVSDNREELVPPSDLIDSLLNSTDYGSDNCILVGLDLHNSDLKGLSTNVQIIHLDSRMQINLHDIMINAWCVR